jgi:hypothetical protein
MAASTAAAGREDAAGAAGVAEAGMISAVEPPLVPLPAQEWQREPVSRAAMLAE